LCDEYRYILCGRVSKIRAKDSEIEAAPISETENSLRRNFIRNPRTWREIGETICYVSLQIDISKASHIDRTGIEVHPSACSLAGYRLREIDLPANPIIEDQLAINPEGILPIEEQSFLAFPRILGAACESTERTHISEQEAS
jgi:hypothetical protein